MNNARGVVIWLDKSRFVVAKYICAVTVRGNDESRSVMISTIDDKTHIITDLPKDSASQFIQQLAKAVAISHSDESPPSAPTEATRIKSIRCPSCGKWFQPDEPEQTLCNPCKEILHSEPFGWPE